MTDILIPLMHNGSKYDNLELRYCLRSIEKHLKDYGNIYIIGEKPDWIKNIIHIPFVDSINNWQRAWNIYRKILVGVNYINDLKVDYVDPRKHEMQVSAICLSNNFLFMNDDHYLLSDYVAGEFPFYHRSWLNLNELEKRNNRPQYIQSKNTVEFIGTISALDFDVHCPIVFSKERFNNVFSILPKIWPEHGYLIKSLYANKVLQQSCNFCEDLKFAERITQKESIYAALEGRNWFSIGDRSLLDGAMQQVLSELYPKPSIYE